MDYPPNQRLPGRPSHSPTVSSLTVHDMDHLRMHTVGFTNNELLSPTLNSQRPSIAQLRPTPAMLSDFMTAEKGPWNQLLASFPSDVNQGASTQTTGPMYSNYRNPPSISVASDSGYASLPKRYLDDISSMGDGSFDPDIQTMSTQFRTNVNFDLPSSRELELPTAKSRRAVAAGASAGSDLKCSVCEEVVKTKSILRKHHQRHTKPFPCKEPGCSREVGFSTQNDLARHQRSVHKTSTSILGKQYKCTINGCKGKHKLWPRADNFRSHLRSVHHIPQEQTNKREYLDQFLRQHVQARNPGQDAPRTATLRPACENNLDLLQGVGGGSIESEMGFPNTLTNWAFEANPPLPSGSSVVPGGDQEMRDFEDLRLEPVDGTMESPDSQQLLRHPDIPRQFQETLSHLPHSRPVSTQGRADSSEAKPFPVPSQGLSQTVPTETTPNLEAELACWAPAQQDTADHALIARTNGHANSESATCKASSSALRLHRPPREFGDVKPTSSYSAALDSSTMSSANIEEKPGIVIPQEINFQDEDEMMKILDRIPKDIFWRYLKEKGIYPSTDNGRDSGDSSPEQKHLCTWSGCGRKFNRRSELNKHTRRHNKPYECTFPKCDKRFGSKSDWRRHENTQHFQLVVWKCDVRTGKKTCPKVCYRRNVFENHLEKQHGIAKGEAQEEAQERCRVDWSSSTKFWCGFCCDVVLINPREDNGAWGQRYDHIGKHFTGCSGFAKADKGGWMSGDMDSSDEEMEALEDAGNLRKRKRDKGEEGGGRARKPRGRV